MAKIKVTGWIDSDDLNDGDADPNHTSGLSEQGYNRMTTYDLEPGYKVADLNDIEIRQVPDGDD